MYFIPDVLMEMKRDESEKVEIFFIYYVQLHISIYMTIFSLQHAPSASTAATEMAKYHIEMCLSVLLVIYESYIFHNLSRQMRR